MIPSLCLLIDSTFTVISPARPLVHSSMTRIALSDHHAVEEVDHRADVIGDDFDAFADTAPDRRAGMVVAPCSSLSPLNLPIRMIDDIAVTRHRRRDAGAIARQRFGAGIQNDAIWRSAASPRSPARARRSGRARRLDATPRCDRKRRKCPAASRSRQRQSP